MKLIKIQCSEGDHQEAKVGAASDGKTLKDWILDLIRRRRKEQERKR